MADILESRKQFILKYFEESMPKDSDFIDIIKSYVYKLINIFDTYIPKIQYCSKTCRSCLRLCTLRLNHKSDCNCGTSHICQNICNKTEQCLDKKYLCVEVFGHTSYHRCNEGNHKCSHHCAIKECKYLCSLEAGHAAEEIHDCSNKHPCSQKCADDFCTRTC